MDWREMQDLLCKLVAIDTSHGHNIPQITQLIGQMFGGIGLDVELLDVPPSVTDGGLTGRVCVVGYYNIGAPQTVVFYTHYDVVGAGNWDEAFTPRIQGSHVYGRGSADMKGGIVALTTGLQAALQGVVNRNAIVWATPDEETANQLTMLRWLADQSGLKSGDDILVFDLDSLLQLTIAWMGMIDFTVRVPGKAAHVGLGKGVNAIDRAIRLIEVLRPRLKARRRRWQRTGSNRLYGRGEVTVMTGGTEHNVTPGSCTFTVNLRLLPREKPELVMEQIRRTMRETGIPHRITAVDMCHGLLTDVGRVPELVRVAREIAGLVPKGQGGSGQVSDWSAQMGWPMIGLGPIRRDANFHGVGEWVNLDDIEQVARVIAGFLTA